MKAKIFDTVSEAQEWNKAFAKSKGCHFPTVYWFAEKPISIDTTAGKAQYAAIMGIPQKLTDAEGNETANPEYENLQDSYLVQKYAVIVGDELDVDGVAPDDVEEILTCIVIATAERKVAANAYVRTVIGYTYEIDLFDTPLTSDGVNTTHYLSSRVATLNQYNLIRPAIEAEAAHYYLFRDRDVDSILAETGLSHV